MSSGYPKMNDAPVVRVLRYRTEKAFHAAMARYRGRIVRWYGDDHYWVIEISA